MIRFLDDDDWVHQGTAYLFKITVCPFCQQDTLSDSFKLQLEQYFDEEYGSSLGRIQKLGRYYRESMQYLESVLDNSSQEKEPS